MLRRVAKQAAIFVFVLSLLALAACDNPSQIGLVGESRSGQSDQVPLDAMPVSKAKQLTHMYIGTGSVQGVYFPIGGVICRLLNRQTSIHRIRCTLESTGGSIYNLRELQKGNFDLVFAQSDWQYNAYHGQSAFEKQQANPDLRAVFALEADPLALIVKKDSGIEQFDDLKDRVVSFGYQRSLQHRVMHDFLDVKGISHDDFKEVRRMRDSRQVQELCEGGVDAILFLSSSLKDRLSNIPEGCDLKLAPIVDMAVNAVIEIYHVVKEVVENFNDFKSLHPSLKQLKKKELPYAGVSIPLHPGAVRYYKEARLLK